MTGRLRSLLVLGLLLAAAAALAGVILDRQHPALPPLEAAAPDSGPGEAFSLPEVPVAELHELAAALEQPLFLRTRSRPVDVQEPVAAPAPSKVEAKLAGVLTTGAQKVAIVFATGSTRAQHLREGDVFQGWQVVEINDDSILLERDGQTETLILDFTGDAPVRP